jgi:hypothetical protein
MGENPPMLEKLMGQVGDPIGLRGFEAELLVGFCLGGTGRNNNERPN